MTSTEQAAAKVTALIRMVEVKTVTPERPAVLKGGGVGSGYIEWPTAFSSLSVVHRGKVRVWVLFLFAGLPGNYGPVGRAMGSF